MTQSFDELLAEEPSSERQEIGGSMEGQTVDADGPSGLPYTKTALDAHPHLGAKPDTNSTGDPDSDADTNSSETPIEPTSFESLLGSPLAAAVSFTAPTDPEEQARRIKELERQLADEREKNRIRGIKATRTPRLAEAIFVDPETDDRFSLFAQVTAFRGAPGLAAKVLVHGGTKNVLTYVDPGPHPRGSKVNPGWENAPSLNFERVLERIARQHPSVVLTVDYVRAVGADLEQTVDKRFNAAHARVHRALNSIAWIALVQEVGLQRARELKNAIKWWLLRDGAEQEPADPKYDGANDTTNAEVG